MLINAAGLNVNVVVASVVDVDVGIVTFITCRLSQLFRDQKLNNFIIFQRRQICSFFCKVFEADVFSELEYFSRFSQKNMRRSFE